MKKTLVALAVAAVAATSANAAVVFDQNGSKVEVNGSLRLVLDRSTNQRTDLINDGSRLSFKGTQDLGSGLSALGYAEIRFEDGSANNTFGNPTTKRLYAGFKQDGVGTLTFGRQLTNLDDLGTSDVTYDLTGINLTQTSGNKVVRFTSAEWGGFHFGLDYGFDSDSAKDGDKDRFWGASAFYKGDFDGVTLDVNAGYSNVKANEDKTTAFLVGTGVELYKKVKFGLDYSQRKNVDDSKDTALEFGTKYQYIDNASVYGAVAWKKTKAANGDSTKTRAFAVGTDYKLHKNVVTYVEFGTEKTKHQDRENTLLAGLRVHF